MHQLNELQAKFAVTGMFLSTCAQHTGNIEHAAHERIYGIEAQNHNRMFRCVHSGIRTKRQVDMKEACARWREINSLVKVPIRIL